MDALLLAIAFCFGLITQRFRLHPLAGFLVSGFVLQAMGKTGGPVLDDIANLGVTLMLFTIGVKLRLRTLARPEIWAGTTLHTGSVLMIFTPVVAGVAALFSGAAGLDRQTALLLAFALSFSSTVFVVKALEECGDMGDPIESIQYFCNRGCPPQQSPLYELRPAKSGLCIQKIGTKPHPR